MRTQMTTLATLLVLSSPGFAQDNEKIWKLDKNHSTVGFSVRHLGISKVRGQFKDFDAVVKADETGKLSFVSASVKVASVDTGIAGRDKHLQAAEFFDAKNHPALRFKTRKITWDTPTSFVATADLIMRGVTKKVVARGELLGTHKVTFGGVPQTRAGYSVSATINRKDFGLNFDKTAEGVGIVSDKVSIEIEVQLSRAQ